MFVVMLVPLLEHMWSLSLLEWSFTSLFLVSRLFNVLYASRCALLLVYSLTNTQEHWAVLLLLIVYHRSALGGINWTDSPSLVCATIRLLCEFVHVSQYAENQMDGREMQGYRDTSAEDIMCSVFCMRDRSGRSWHPFSWF